MDFSVRSRLEGGSSVLDVRGEIDMLTAPRLQAAITESLDRPAAPILVNLEGVTFMDSTGLRALVESRERAESAGVRLTLVGPSRQVRRLLSLTGLERFFDVQDSLTQATGT